MTPEQWKSIVGFEGRYEVSNKGRVRSVGRDVPMLSKRNEWGTRTVKSRVLALHTWGAKYPGVVLVAADGVKTRRMVHQLVAVAFVPNQGGYEQINHIDADRSNCCAENLEWCNQSMNVAHVADGNVKHSDRAKLRELKEKS